MGITVMEKPLIHRSDLERYASAFLSRYLEDGRSDVSRNPSDAFSTLLPSEVVTELQK